VNSGTFLPHRIDAFARLIIGRYFKMKFVNFFASVTAILVLSSVVSAQDEGLFSGQGIQSAGSGTKDAAKPKWPIPFDFSKKDSKTKTGASIAELFSKTPKAGKVDKPKFEFPKFGVSESAKKAMPSFSDLFPKPDPDRPNFFKDINDKSKDFWGKTTNWTQRRSDTIKRKSFGDWDAVKKDMRALENAARRAQQTTPAQPPVRTAEALDQPTVRF